MKVLIASLALLLTLASSIGVMPTANASTSVVVRLPACGHGETTVPAGSEVIIGTAWVSIARIGVTQFLEAAEHSVSINGVPLADQDLQYGPITRNLVVLGRTSAIDLPSYWGTQWSYSLGTLDAGEVVVVDSELALTESILDVNVAVRPVAFRTGPGVVFAGSCTIRAE